MMTCPERNILTQILDGFGPAREFAQHLGQCSACQRELDELTEIPWRLEDSCEESIRPAFLEKLTEVVVAAVGAGLPDLSAALSSSGLAIEGYNIDSELGRGGMGIVYRAKQCRLERDVALKILLVGRHAGPKDRARFQAEAKAAARVKHPHIVAIFDVGEAQDSDGAFPYMALEYVNGGTLAHLTKGQPQPPRDAAGFIVKLALAMHAAHGEGLIHRDLKPANILLQRPTDLPADVTLTLVSAIPKVADFGLAFCLDDQAHLTRTGEIVGTPSYMAPEQARGERAALGPTVDIYALGAILYELLTGRPPFKAASTTETLLLVAHEEPLALQRLNPAIPRDLATICLKCLEKSPARRFESAEGLADDLQRYLDNKPIHARPAPRWEVVGKWMRRHPAASAAILACVLSLVGGPALAIWLFQERNSTRQAEEQEQVHRYFRNIMLADREWSTGQWSQADELLETCTPWMRGWEWHHAKLRLQGETRILRGHDGTVYAIAMNSSGKTLASAGADGTIRLWEADTGREVDVLCRQENGIGSVVWGSGAIVYWIAEDGSAVEFDTDIKMETRRFEQSLIPGTGGGISFLTYCPSRKLLAAVCGGGTTVKVWNAATGADISSFEREPLWNSKSPLTFTPDGQHLAIVSTNAKQTAVRVMHVTQRREVFVHASPGRLFSVAFSPDGKTLGIASSGRDDRTAHTVHIDLLNWETGKHLHTLSGHTNRINALCFSPDGQRLATGGLRTIRLWDCQSGEPTLVLRSPTEIASLAFDATGDFVAAAGHDGTIRILGTRSEQGVARLPHKTRVNMLAYSPARNHLALAGFDNSITVLDRDTGQPIFQGVHPGTWRGVQSAAFSPDGELLATTAKDEAVRIWSTKSTVRALPHARANAAKFSPDGQRIATAAEDGTIKIWDAASDSEQAELIGHQAKVSHLSFSPDGLTLASQCEDGTVRLWDVASAAQVWSRSMESPEVVAFSPDGKRIATNSGRILKILDARTGKELVSTPGHAARIATLAWSPDGKRLSSGSDDKTIRIWDPIRGIEILTLNGHRGGIISIAFDPSGRFLTSASWDGTVKMWDGRPVAK